MATYKIMREKNGEITETGLQSSRKRDIEVMFNRFLKGWRKDSKFYVQDIRIGYSKVTYMGMFGDIETEYWIARN